MPIQTHTVTLPAYWASALINNDMSGMSHADRTELQAWESNHPEYGAALDCSTESFIQRYDGRLTDCLEYVFPIVKIPTD